MSELIGIREAARRIGVSDTAVHKAIKAGRVSLADPDPKNGRPRVSWPEAGDQWAANSDHTKRTHVGSRGSPRREKYAPDEPAMRQPLIGDGGPDAAAAADTPRTGGPSYAQSRAVREAYQARLAKLEFEERSGKLVSGDQVKADAFKAARTTRDALINIPDRVAHELAAETDPQRVHIMLSNEIRAALAGLHAELAEAA